MARRILPHAPAATLNRSVLAGSEIATEDGTGRPRLGDGLTLGGRQLAFLSEVEVKANQDDMTKTIGRVALMEGTVMSGRRGYATWADMLADTTPPNDTLGEVPITDTGTHNQGGSPVPNSGVYRKVSTGWLRLYDVDAVSAGDAADRAEAAQLGAETAKAQTDQTKVEVQAIAATLPNILPVNFTEAAQPIDFVVDATGRFIDFQMSDGSLTPTEAPRLASAAYGRSPVYTTIPRAIAITSVPHAGVEPGLNNVPRIPLLYRCANGRIVFFYQGRETTDDFSVSNITYRTREPGSRNWSAEKILVRQDAAYHIDNLSGVYDPVTGRDEFLLGVTPVGATEGTLIDPTTDPAKASRLYSFYSADNCTTFRNQAGTLLPVNAVATDLTWEDEARSPDDPLWNVGPGNAGEFNQVTDECMIAGNCAGIKGVAGTGSPPQSWAGFIFYRDRASKRWRWRGKTPLGWGTNESRIRIMRDGRIRMDARQHSASLNSRRVVHVSTDATGSEWAESYFDDARVDARVQGSGCRMAGGYGDPGLSVTVTANCTVNTPLNAGNRYGLTLFLSVDDEASFPWGGKRVFGDNPVTISTDVNGNPLATPITVTHFNTAYSSMCPLDAETVLLVFEGLAVWPDGSTQWPYRVIYEQERNIRSLMV